MIKDIQEDLKIICQSKNIPYICIV
jgi:hypothetical protein